MDHVRHTQLREGSAGSADAHRARRFTGPISQRAHRRAGVVRRKAELLDEKQARQICEAVLRLSGPDPAEVYLLGEELALTRFAANAIHQNVTEQNQGLRLRLRRGRRVGEAITNRSSPADLEGLVARARAMAEPDAEESDLPELTGAQQYLPVVAFDAATAGMSPESRARAVGAVGQAARRRKVGAYGAFSTGWQAMAVANTGGLFGYQPTTLADFQTVVMDTDSSGQAHASAWRASDLDPRALGEEAIQKAVSGRGPRAIEPGRFDVVLDPYASHDLLDMLNLHGIGGRLYQEGRSWMNGREGQQAMAPTVDLWDDPQAPELLPRSFDAEGSPKRRIEIVSRGVVRGPVHDRRTAGDASSGHAPSPFAPAWLRAIGPSAGHLVLGAGGSPARLRGDRHAPRRRVRRPGRRAGLPGEEPALHPVLRGSACPARGDRIGNPLDPAGGRGVGHPLSRAANRGLS